MSKRKIINLEMNEVSPNLINDYITQNTKSNLAKLKNEKKLISYTTKALDIPKNKLYPSQTWASFNTGKSYQEHKCYWYSDNIKIENLLWNKLAQKNISVGILGSIHSSKFLSSLITNKNYKFYIPDCFSSNNFTKPFKYKSFQVINNQLVGDSARVTGLTSIIKSLFNNFFKIIFSPRRFGISLFSIKMILSIIYFSLLYKNKEILRMAQFPLIASIYSDLFIKYQPSYSTLFSNHVAGNMHRYWYAHDLDSFKDKNKYSKKWIKRNKSLIFLGLDFIDEYIGFILKKKEFKDSTILLTSSMGQEANQEFDSKFLAKYDGKIKNMNLFLKQLSFFQEKYYGEAIEFNCDRNMSPQYGFKLIKKNKLDIKTILKSISHFVEELGFNCKVDEQQGSIVLTVYIYSDKSFQKKYSLKSANKKFSKYGFKFFPINDHHSGAHCEDGSMIVINSTKQLKSSISKFLDNKGYINYLNFHKLITDYFSISS